jgi:hypothetical protein
MKAAKVFREKRYKSQVVVSPPMINLPAVDEDKFFQIIECLEMNRLSRACAICRMEYRGVRWRIKSCGHIMHSRCLYAWMLETEGHWGAETVGDVRNVVVQGSM